MINTQSGVNATRIPYLRMERNNRQIHFRRYHGSDDHAVLAEISQQYWDSIGVDVVIDADDTGRSIKYTRNLNPWRNLIIAEVSGNPVGFTQVNWFQETEGPRVYRVITRMKPEGLEYKLHQPLWNFAAGRLKQLARRHPRHIEKFFAATAAETDKSSAAFLQQIGFKPVRYFFDMVRSLDKPIPALELPSGIEVRPTTPEYYRKVLAALDEAFLDHWGHRPITESEIQWYFESPDFQPDLWKVAWDGDQVVGMVLNYIDDAENKRYGRKRGYTEDIAVRRPWRRRGIAKTLISQSLRLLDEKGMEQAALGVDTQNPSGALGLYHGLGYEEVKTYIDYRLALKL